MILSLISAPNVQNNGFIYAKIFGGFGNIRTSVCSYFPFKMSFTISILLSLCNSWQTWQICDLVAISRLLNATLVIPEIQQSLRSKGIRYTVFQSEWKNIVPKCLSWVRLYLILCSSMFKSFSYIYDAEKFIAALANDVIIVTDLPPNLKEARKRKQLPTYRPQSTDSPSFYRNNILPKLKKAKVIGLIITDGGCLQV